jgi:hypothetical protein
VENLPVYQYSEHENSWRSKFWAMPVLIHGIVELVLTVVIIILEIASLGISTYDITGAGIWCSLSFMSAAISTILLGKYSKTKYFFITEIVYFSKKMGSSKILGYTCSYFSNSSDCIQFYSDRH